MLCLALRFAIVAALAALSGSATAVRGAGTGPDPHRVVHGMTVSCQTWGWEWGSDAMPRTMDELRAMGVNWIAIHPYGRVHSAVQAREHPEFIDAISHDDGIDVTVKPEALDHAVTLTLHVISAAVIPWRPRRRRR